MAEDVGSTKSTSIERSSNYKAGWLEVKSEDRVRPISIPSSIW
jgi:hypothetical protein